MPSKDKQKHNENQRLSHARHRESQNLRRRQAYAADPKKFRDQAKTWEDAHRNSRLFTDAKRRAKSLNLEFNITKEDIIIPERCPILDILIDVRSGKGKAMPNSPSLDRVDNDKGYIKGNIRVISHRANTCKSDLSFQDIERLHKYIAPYTVPLPGAEQGNYTACQTLCQGLARQQS